MIPLYWFFSYKWDSTPKYFIRKQNTLLIAFQVIEIQNFKSQISNLRIKNFTSRGKLEPTC